MTLTFNLPGTSPLYVAAVLFSSSAVSMATVSATSIVFSPRGVPGKDDGEEGWEREKGREEKEGGKNGGRQSMSKGGMEENEVQ